MRAKLPGRNKWHTYAIYFDRNIPRERTANVLIGDPGTFLLIHETARKMVYNA